jgi:hypothetical protein
VSTGGGGNVSTISVGKDVSPPEVIVRDEDNWSDIRTERDQSRRRKRKRRRSTDS